VIAEGTSAELKASVGGGALTNSGVGVTDFSLGRPRLDEVFMALTGHPAEDQTENAEQEEVTA